MSVSDEPSLRRLHQRRSIRPYAGGRTRKELRTARAAEVAVRVKRPGRVRPGSRTRISAPVTGTTKCAPEQVAVVTVAGQRTASGEPSPGPRSVRATSRAAAVPASVTVVLPRNVLAAQRFVVRAWPRNARYAG